MNNRNHFPAGQTFLCMLFFVGVMCFSHIHQGSLSVDAIRYAHLSKQIQDSGDIRNLVDGYRQTPYANKPPLLFWLTAKSFDLLGRTTFAAKLPAVTFVFAALLLVWRTNRRKGELAALLSVVLIVANRSFALDLIDFGFDGLSLFGTALCFGSILEFFKDRPPERDSGIFLLLGTGLCALLLSKPPYVAFVLAPLAVTLLVEKRLLEMRSLRRVVYVILPMIPALAWYASVGTDYRKQAYNNQLVDSFTVYRGYLSNLVGWSRSLFLTHAPLSWIGAAATLAVLRRKDRPAAELFLSLTFLQFIPVVLFVSCRPRYLWSPMLAGALLAGPYLATRFPNLNVERISRALVAFSVAFLVMVIGVGVPLHRTNTISKALKARPELLEQPDFAVCVQTDSDKETPRKAKQTGLLLNFEYGVRDKVFTAQNVPASARTVLADKDCLKLLSSLEGACFGQVSGCKGRTIIPAL